MEATEVVLGSHQEFPTEIAGEAWIAQDDTFVQLERGTGRPLRAVRITDVDEFVAWNAIDAFRGRLAVRPGRLARGAGRTCAVPGIACATVQRTVRGGCMSD